MARIIICIECGEEKEHWAKGRCKGCYLKWYHAEHRKKRNAYSRRYHQENQESISTRKHRYYEENQETRIIYSRQYRQGHLEKIRERDRQVGKEKYWADPEKARVRNHEQYQRHRGKRLAYAKHYRQENAEIARAACRRWQRENAERVAMLGARRKARKHHLPDTLTSRQTKQLLEIGQAIYPSEALHLDHIVPLSKGGGTTYANMHAIPAKLNQIKHDKLPEEVYKQEELF